MSRMKTFFRYFLIFVSVYIISNLLINAYIKTSYYKITKYDIDVKEATVTILTAKASKDDGYIEGKISNGTKEEIKDKYMVVELFSENEVSLGKEYIKIESFKPGTIKDFKVRFTYNYVRSFKITVISAEEKSKIDQERDKPLFTIKTNEQVDKIINQMESEKSK